MTKPGETVANLGKNCRIAMAVDQTGQEDDQRTRLESRREGATKLTQEED
jgi:hypothetical protein